MSKFAYFVKIFKTKLIGCYSQKIVTDPVKIEIFKGTRSYRIPYQYLSMLPKGENCLISKDALLTLDEENYHIEIMAKTEEENPELAERICVDEIDRIITNLSIIYKPELFCDPIYSGWVLNERSIIKAWIRVSEKIQVEKKHLCDKLQEIKRNQYSDQDIFERFQLMSRFFVRSLTLKPSEEKYVFLWTILEIFPMQNQTKIRPILNYLANITGKNSNVVDKKLGIGRIFKIRCDLVHNGKFDVALEEQGEFFTKLENIVLEILRTISGLNYSGSLDKYL